MSNKNVGVLEFGFASWKDQSFELIVRDPESGREVTLKGKLEDGQLEAIDRIFPTCVFVKYRPSPIAASGEPNAKR